MKTNYILPLPSSIDLLIYTLINSFMLNEAQVEYIINRLLEKFFEYDLQIPLEEVVKLKQELLSSINRFIYERPQSGLDLPGKDSFKEGVDILENTLLNIYKDLMNITASHLLPNHFFMYLNFMNNGIVVTMIPMTVTDQEICL